MPTGGFCPNLPETNPPSDLHVPVGHFPYLRCLSGSFRNHPANGWFLPELARNKSSFRPSCSCRPLGYFLADLRSRWTAGRRGPTVHPCSRRSAGGGDFCVYQLSKSSVWIQIYTDLAARMGKGNRSGSADCVATPLAAVTCEFASFPECVRGNSRGNHADRGCLIRSYLYSAPRLMIGWLGTEHCARSAPRPLAGAVDESAPVCAAGLGRARRRTRFSKNKGYG